MSFLLRENREIKSTRRSLLWVANSILLFSVIFVLHIDCGENYVVSTFLIFKHFMCTDQSLADPPPPADGESDRFFSE